MTQWIWVGVFVVLYTAYTVYTYTLHKKINETRAKLNALSVAYGSAIKLILAETKRREEHKKAFSRLTDPEAIADDMERGARVREMYDANRNTLPREDAGPPAKVYSPRLRAKVPKSKYKNAQD